MLRVMKAFVFCQGYSPKGNRKNISVSHSLRTSIRQSKNIIWDFPSGFVSSSSYHEVVRLRTCRIRRADCDWLKLLSDMPQCVQLIVGQRRASRTSTFAFCRMYRALRDRFPSLTFLRQSRACVVQVSSDNHTMAGIARGSNIHTHIEP
jgi:hypothetical protein